MVEDQASTGLREKPGNRDRKGCRVLVEGSMEVSNKRGRKKPGLGKNLGQRSPGREWLKDRSHSGKPHELIKIMSQNG